MADVVLLEWEGVLADTQQVRRDALRRALSAEGVAHTLSDDDEQLRGLGVRAAVRVVMRHIGSSDVILAELLEMRARREFASHLAQGLVLTLGATAFVERLQARVRVAVVSRASRDECESVLRQSGLEPAVSAIVCADDIDDDAPSIGLYQHAVARLGRLRSVAADSVAIVDRGASIRAARDAGVRVVCVGAPRDEAADADVAVDTLGDLRPSAWLSSPSAVQRAGGA